MKYPITERTRRRFLLLVSGILSIGSLLLFGAFFLPSVHAQTNDVTVTIESDTPMPHQGELYQYVVVASSEFQHVGTTIDLRLPSEVSIMSYQFFGGEGAQVNLAQRKWDTGAMDPSYRTVLTITARYDGWNVGKSVSVIASTWRSQASAIITPVQAIADLQLVQTVDRLVPAVGETVAHTLTLSNAGPSTVNSATILVEVSDGLEIVSGSSGSGLFDRENGIWTTDHIASDEEITLNFVTRATELPELGLMVIAEVIGSSTIDYRPGNERAIVMLDAVDKSADLALAVSTSIDEPTEMTSFEYQVVVSNQGPAAADSVKVESFIDAALLFGAVDTTHGLFDLDKLTWEIPALEVGEEAILSLLLAPDYGTEQRVLALESSLVMANQYDNSTGDNSDSTQVVAKSGQIDLALAQDVDTLYPTPQSEVTFSTVLTNESDEVATSVQIAHEMPTGIALTGVKGAGNYDVARQLWTIPTVLPRESVTLTVIGVVGWNYVGEVLSSQATLVGADQVDGVTSNNLAQTEISPVASAADLRLLQLVSNENPVEGESVAFTLLVSNGGQQRATNIRVSHELGEGIDFVTAQPQVGTYDELTGIWEIPTLRAGGSTGLVITGMVREGFADLTVTSLATIIGFDQGVLDPETSSVSVILMPQREMVASE